MAEWHIITGEYPPLQGGVSDYTRIVAEGLTAAGDEVVVWCPALAGDGRSRDVCETRACDDEGSGYMSSHGLTVRRELASFAPSDWRRLGRMLDEERAPRRLLVQYVPHLYGYRAMNLPLCLWLWKRARFDGDEVQIVLHEPFLDFGGNPRQRAVAFVQRLMAAVILNGACRVWTTTRAWEDCWRPYAFGRRVRFNWLPVPCTIPVACDPTSSSDTVSVRARYVPRAGHSLVGHLGTYPQHIAAQLRLALPALLAKNASVSVLLMGRGSTYTRDALIASHPSLAGRIHATGLLDERELSTHLAACDVLVQPFTDGVSTRRTSVMAGLAHGLPIVTTCGRLTETLWAKSNAVKLVPADDAAALSAGIEQLLNDAPERTRLRHAARTLYRERFDVSHIVAALRRERTAAEIVDNILPSEVKA
ncbi:MAG: glycosyltransferase family 4 protein [Pyrinomonadaceae bacterium]